MQLHATKLGIAFGIVYAVLFFLWGLLAAVFGWGGAMAEMIGSFYLGFGPTLAGALVGALWGFAVGFVFFALAAWIYNRLVG
ncbi:MAG: bacteriophage holin [Geminicoccaceae bacterium]